MLLVKKDEYRALQDEYIQFENKYPGCCRKSTVRKLTRFWKKTRCHFVGDYYFLCGDVRKYMRNCDGDHIAEILEDMDESNRSMVEYFVENEGRLRSILCMP